MPNADTRICPVFWLDYMLWLMPGVPSDPTYSVPRGVEQVNAALSYSQYTNILRRWLKAAGFPAKMYSTHSLCRGATWAARTGLPGHVIKVMGAWREQAYLKYIEVTLQDKCEAMHLFTLAM